MVKVILVIALLTPRRSVGDKPCAESDTLALGNLVVNIDTSFHSDEDEAERESLTLALVTRIVSLNW